MPSFNTPIASTPSNAWPNSFYFVRTDSQGANLQAIGGSEIAETRAHHANLSAPAGTASKPYIGLKTFGSQEWQDGTVEVLYPVYGGGVYTVSPGAPYFVDTWPTGTPISRPAWNLSAGGNLTSTPNHLWFNGLRQENARGRAEFFGVISTSSYAENLAADPGIDRHALLWSPTTNELVEAIGYTTVGPYGLAAEDVVTYNTSSYTLPNMPNGLKQGVVAARIPLAPLLFNYADVQAAISGSGDLGHILGFVANNYSSGEPEWPARGGDGELANGLRCGMILRLKADENLDFDPTLLSPAARVIVRTLQRYGVILFDKNSSIAGPNLNAATIACPADAQWPNGVNDIGNEIGTKLDFNNFEIVDISPIFSGADSILANVQGTNPAPIASFTSSANGLTVTFNGSSSTDPNGNIVSFQWNFGDGQGATGVTNSHTYGTGGTYTVSLTVTDNDGASNTTTQSITVVRPNTPPVAIISGPTSGTIPATVTFGAGSSFDGDGTIVSYAWNFGDGATATGSLVNHTYTQTGIYTVTLTVTDNNGATDTDTLSFVALPIPNANPVAEGYVVSISSGTGAPRTVALTSSSYDSDGVIQSWLWDFGDGTPTSNYAQAQHTYNQPGTYTATLTVTDNNGLTGTTTVEVVVTERPQANFTISALTGDAPLTVNVNGSGSTAPAGAIVDWSWDFGDGAIYTPTSYYPKMVVVGDSLSAWGSATGANPGPEPLSGWPTPYSPSDRWHDLLVQRGIVGTVVDATYPGYNTRQARYFPRAVAQSADLTVIHLGANDQVHIDRQFLGVPAVIPDPSEWVLPSEYADNLRALLDMYPASKQVIVFPWRWNISMLDSVLDNDFTYASRRDQYLFAAQAVATERSATLVDMGQIYNLPRKVGTPLYSHLSDQLIHASGIGHDSTANQVVSLANLVEVVPTNGASINHTYYVPGTYEVTLTVTDNLGQTATSTKSVLVTEPAGGGGGGGGGGTFDVFLSVDKTEAYVQSILSFNASASTTSNIVSVWFDPGNGDPFYTDIGQIQQFYSRPGIYTATVTVTDSTGATGTASTTVTINSNTGIKPVPKIGINGLSAADTRFAVIGSAPFTINIDLTESIDPDGQIVSYAFLNVPTTYMSNYELDNGENQTGLFQLTYDQPGEYFLYCAVIDDSGSFSFSRKAIYVTKTSQASTPQARFNWRTTSDDTVDGSSVPVFATFDASDSSSNDSTIWVYEWLIEGEYRYGKKINYVFSEADESGFKTVVLNVYDEYGNSHFVSHQIAVTNPEPATFGDFYIDPDSGSSPLTVEIGAPKDDIRKISTGVGVTATGIHPNGTFWVAGFSAAKDSGDPESTSNSSIPWIEVFDSNGRLASTSTSIFNYYFVFGYSTEVISFVPAGDEMVAIVNVNYQNAEGSGTVTFPISFSASVETGIPVGDIIFDPINNWDPIGGNEIYKVAEQVVYDGTKIWFSSTLGASCVVSSAYNRNNVEQLIAVIPGTTFKSLFFDGGKIIALTDGGITAIDPETAEIIGTAASQYCYNAIAAVPSYESTSSSAGIGCVLIRESSAGVSLQDVTYPTASEPEGYVEYPNTFAAVKNVYKAIFAGGVNIAINPNDGSPVNLNGKSRIFFVHREVFGNRTLVTTFHPYYGPLTSTTGHDFVPSTATYAGSVSGMENLPVIVTYPEASFMERYAASPGDPAKTRTSTSLELEISSNDSTVKPPVSLWDNTDYDYNGTQVYLGTSKTSYTFQTDDTYGVTLRTTSNYGDSAVYRKTVQVGNITNEPPVADIQVSENTGNAPLTVIFDGSASYDPDGGEITYQWSGSDGWISFDGVTEHTFTQPGTYTVTLTVTDDLGATDTKSVTITVSPSNAAPVAVITTGIPTSPLSADFSGANSYDVDGIIVNYEWDFGDGEFAVGSNVVHEYAQPGVYVVKLTVTDEDGAYNTAELEYRVPTVAVLERTNVAPLSKCPPDLLDINLFEGQSYTFADEVGSWTVEESSAIEPSRYFMKYDDMGSLKLTCGESAVTIQSGTYETTDRWKNRTPYGGIWVFSTDTITVEMDLILTVGAEEFVTTTDTLVRQNRWTWVDTTGQYSVPDNRTSTMTIRLTVTGHELGDEVFFSSPLLTNLQMMLDSSFTNEIWLRLPEYIRDSDAQMTPENYQLLRFINMMYGVAGQIEFMWNWIKFVPVVDGGDDSFESASKLVDPRFCCPQYLPWVGRVLGVDLISPATGFTAWDDLAFSFNNSTPDPLENWSEWETEPDLSGNTDGATDWFEVEGFNPFPTDLIDYARWQVESAVFGLRGGTTKALKEATRKVLQGTKTVQVVVNPDSSGTPMAGDSPWRIHLLTLVSETPDVEYAGGPSSTVMKAIQQTIPAGYHVIHYAVDNLESPESVTYGGTAIYGSILSY